MKHKIKLKTNNFKDLEKLLQPVCNDLNGCKFNCKYECKFSKCKTGFPMFPDNFFNCC